MKKFNTLNFKNQRVIIRVDFNVPLNEKLEVTDDTRIRASLDTINKIINDGGSVVLMSHFGRPKKQEPEFSLKNILPTLEKLLNKKVKFANNCISDEAFSLTSNLKDGEIILLENLRYYKEETNGDLNFAEKLSKHATFYINDAFGSAHREHASTSVIAKFFKDKKAFGYLMENEVESVRKILDKPQKPTTAILGGSKVSSKIGIIENLLNKVDNLIIGGGMTYTFIKALGGKIGDSIVENDKLDLALNIIKKAEQKNVKLHLAKDIVIADKFDNEANKKTCKVSEIPDGWSGLDIGEETIKSFCKVISESKTILWNGPVGVFEFKNFENGTHQLAKCIVNSTKNGCFSLVGGGDSVAAVNKFGLADKVSYVSTGGGALLEMIEGLILPGVKAIEE